MVFAPPPPSHSGFSPGITVAEKTHYMAQFAPSLLIVVKLKSNTVMQMADYSVIDKVMGGT